MVHPSLVIKTGVKWLQGSNNPSLVQGSMAQSLLSGMNSISFLGNSVNFRQFGAPVNAGPQPVVPATPVSQTITWSKGGRDINAGDVPQGLKDELAQKMQTGQIQYTLGQLYSAANLSRAGETKGGEYVFKITQSPAPSQLSSVGQSSPNLQAYSRAENKINSRNPRVRQVPQEGLARKKSQNVNPPQGGASGFLAKMLDGIVSAVSWIARSVSKLFTSKSKVSTASSREGKPLQSSNASQAKGRPVATARAQSKVATARAQPVAKDAAPGPSAPPMPGFSVTGVQKQPAMENDAQNEGVYESGQKESKRPKFDSQTEFERDGVSYTIQASRDFFVQTENTEIDQMVQELQAHIRGGGGSSLGFDNAQIICNQPQKLQGLTSGATASAPPMSDDSSKSWERFDEAGGGSKHDGRGSTEPQGQIKFEIQNSQKMRGGTYIVSGNQGDLDKLTNSDHVKMAREITQKMRGGAKAGEKHTVSGMNVTVEFRGNAPIQASQPSVNANPSVQKTPSNPNRKWTRVDRHQGKNNGQMGANQFKFKSDDGLILKIRPNQVYRMRTSKFSNQDLNLFVDGLNQSTGQNCVLDKAKDGSWGVSAAKEIQLSDGRTVEATGKPGQLAKLDKDSLEVMTSAGLLQEGKSASIAELPGVKLNLNKAPESKQQAGQGHGSRSKQQAENKYGGGSNQQAGQGHDNLSTKPVSQPRTITGGVSKNLTAGGNRLKQMNSSSPAKGSKYQGDRGPR